MTIPPVPRLKSIPASPLAVGAIRTYGTGMFAYGTAVVIQGPGRWSGPAYATATAVAPSWKWGLIIAILGLCTVIGSLRGWFLIRNVGLYGSAAWLGTFAVAVLDVARHDPHVSYAASILYATLGVGMCLVARGKEGRPAHDGFSPRP